VEAGSCIWTGLRRGTPGRDRGDRGRCGRLGLLDALAHRCRRTVSALWMYSLLRRTQAATEPYVAG